MKKVIITFNPNGVVTWEPMPKESGFDPGVQAGVLAMAGEMFGPRDEKLVKPHQFDKEYFVECTADQRWEIIRAAQQFGRNFCKYSIACGSESPNLFWNEEENRIEGTEWDQSDDFVFDWIPFSEFLARLKGEWEPVEEKPEPDYASFIGKWIRYIGKADFYYTIDKWYQVFQDVTNNETGIKVKDNGGADSYCNNSSGDYIGFLNEFDLTDPRDTNPDEPIETVIPWDYDRWKKGEFVRVENAAGEEVKQLTEFDADDYPLIGIVRRESEGWEKTGEYGNGSNSRHNLRLVVLQTPK